MRTRLAIWLHASFRIVKQLQLVQGILKIFFAHRFFRMGHKFKTGSPTKNDGRLAGHVWAFKGLYGVPCGDNDPTPSTREG